MEDNVLKLTDTQLVILSAAAKRDGSSVLPLPGKLKLAGDPTDVFKDLIKKKLVAEQPADAEFGMLGARAKTVSA